MTLTLARIHQAQPILLPEMESAALDALRNDRYVGGENVVKFEEEFAKYIGVDHAISTSSGTNALEFILVALGAKGKKYVTTPLSFIASSNAILQASGEPIFADISQADYCLSPELAEKRIKEGQASGLLPVHIYGQPADMDSFVELSSKYAVPLVEDACQAHGASFGGKKIGSLGTAAAFSFYPSKNMTVLGDGGMVTTNDEKLAKLIAKLRDCGRISRYEHDVLGYTSRLNSVNAAIGRVQLKHLDEWNEKRMQVASSYSKRLQSLVKIPPGANSKAKPVYHQYVILSRERDRLKAHLESRGIETGIHYPIPIHLQPLYVKTYGYQGGEFASSESFCRECLSLPMHPSLSNEEVDRVCSGIEEFYARSSA